MVPKRLLRPRHVRHIDHASQIIKTDIQIQVGYFEYSSICIDLFHPVLVIISCSIQVKFQMVQFAENLGTPLWA